MPEFEENNPLLEDRVGLVYDDDDDGLLHYGIIRRSGRYPWGSGGNSSSVAAANDFAADLKALKAKGWTESQIAKAFELTSTELRANIAISGLIRKQDQINTAQRLRDSNGTTQMSVSAIAREMGLNESSVRGLLSDQATRKQNQLEGIVDKLRERVEDGGYIDVGKGNEHYLGVTKTKLHTALTMLKTEGYAVESVNVPNVTGSNETKRLVLAKKGETWSSINLNKDKIQPMQVFSNDRGDTFQLVQEPLKLNPKRLDIKYGDQGGAEADGMIYVRPGIKDLDMGGASYAQVRIQVGDNHYIKGMAVLKDGLPAGVDLQFNTNKKSTGNKLDALKEVKPDSEPLERFGALYRQKTDPKTGKVTSHLNIVNDEENWEKWSKSLATQMLSKQKPDFVKKQLDVTYAEKKAQLDEILALTNPVVKKELLKSYADDMDSSSVHLKAAALPRQKTHVLIAVKSLKDNEVYAPGYTDGERVVLIRYPHGGKFEIPELIVNNRNREANTLLPKATTKSAIGINSKVAQILSGADFDGDTVVVIPNGKRKIQKEPPLQELKNFDPQEQYRGSAGKDSNGKHIPLPGVKIMKNTQTEMGKISNLITDMTIAGAPNSEIARAVRHSMVVIDAEKHGLDYARSAKENGIKSLQQKYQPGTPAGASTLISRTKGKVTVPEFKRRTEAQGGGTDPVTGEAIYVPTGRLKSRRIEDPVTGEVTWVKDQLRTVRVPAGSRPPGGLVIDRTTGKKVPIKDAYDLVSGPADTPRALKGTPVERHYADYSNRVKDLANQARLADLNTPDPRVSLSAKKVYAKEVASLNAKVKVAAMNSPRERQAQTAASVIVKMRKEANPEMTQDEIKRASTAALRTTRERLGAKPQRVVIEPREWEAIQNNAVAAATLREVLAKADMQQVKELAQPRTTSKLPAQSQSLARVLLNSGNYTRAEIAERFGVSVSTLDRALS